MRLPCAEEGKEEARAQLEALKIMPAGYDFAIREAVAGNDRETLRLLIIAEAANTPLRQRRQHALTPGGRKGETPLDYARNSEIRQLLIEAGGVSGK